MREKKWKNWLYWFSLALAIIIVFNLFNNFENFKAVVGNFLKILSPFLAGLLIAYILFLPTRGIEKKIEKSKVKFISKKARPLSVLLIYIIILVIIVIAMKFLIPKVYESIVELINNSQSYVTNMINKFSELPEDSFLKKDFLQEAIQQLKNIDIMQVLNYIAGIFSVATSVLNVFVAIIVSVYVLVERSKLVKALKRFVYAIFKDDTANKIIRYFNNSNEYFFKFLSSQVLDGIVIGILTSIAMSILGVKYAVLLGFFIGLFNLIPYFGAIFAVAISAIITLLTGGLVQAIWMLVIVIILQQIDANIINPKIVGGSLKLSPLLVIFAVTIGGAYFGILGMFLGAPVAAKCNNFGFELIYSILHIASTSAIICLLENPFKSIAPDGQATVHAPQP